MSIRTKYSKTNVELSNFVTDHCDKRQECDRRCSAKGIDGLTVKQSDVAYAETRHCEKFKSRGGRIEGADIKEIGVWV